MSADDRAATKSVGLDATVERVVDGVAYLRLADGQRLQWPTHLLPAVTAAGSSVTVSVLSETARAQLARALANELLDVGQSPAAIA